VRDDLVYQLRFERCGLSSPRSPKTNDLILKQEQPRELQYRPALKQWYTILKVYCQGTPLNLRPFPPFTQIEQWARHYKHLQRIAQQSRHQKAMLNMLDRYRMNTENCLLYRFVQEYELAEYDDMRKTMSYLLKLSDTTQLAMDWMIYNSPIFYEGSVLVPRLLDLMSSNQNGKESWSIVTERIEQWLDESLSTMLEKSVQIAKRIIPQPYYGIFINRLVKATFRDFVQDQIMTQILSVWKERESSRRCYLDTLALVFVKVHQVLQGVQNDLTETSSQELQQWITLTFHPLISSYLEMELNQLRKFYEREFSKRSAPNANAATMTVAEAKEMNAQFSTYKQFVMVSIKFIIEY
jgi:hypothetical protein